MAVKIRLQRKGRKKRPFYHIVVADARAPRDGRFIEKLGSYNPMTKPATIELDRDLAFDWLMKGAQPTETARAILRFKGVMYRKHLNRGVLKGALTQEQADEMYQKWVEEKEAKIEARRQQSLQEIADFHKRISGEAPKVAPPTPAASEDNEPGLLDSDKTLAESVEQTTVDDLAPAAEETAEAPAEEAAETPAEEPAAEEAVAEAPVEEAAAEAPAEEAEAEAPTEEAEAPAEEASEEDKKED